jgi:hypothetical protein
MQRIKKTRSFARARLPRQMRLSSDGRILGARISAGQKAGLYEASRFIVTHYYNKGYTPAELREMRAVNGCGRPPLWRD